MKHLFQLSLVPSTRRSYSSGQRRFFQFCATFELLHPSGSPSPVSEATLELFVSHLSSSVSYRTVKCYLAAEAVVKAAQNIAISGSARFRRE